MSVLTTRSLAALGAIVLAWGDLGGRRAEFLDRARPLLSA